MIEITYDLFLAMVDAVADPAAFKKAQQNYTNSYKRLSLVQQGEVHKLIHTQFYNKPWLW